ncbi:hypothetical protein OG211_18080 [Streptomyces niveus]|uniref:hypothetical protein n=1 Tax=Streptomyces niveus TaxID=193462 RepID=UPI0034355E42|nr:hypothetical protein OG211_18080 [Streptomyces niveus]
MDNSWGPQINRGDRDGSPDTPNEQNADLPRASPAKDPGETFDAFLMQFPTERRKKITLFSRALTNEPTSRDDLPEPDPQKKLRFFRIHAAVA